MLPKCHRHTHTPHTHTPHTHTPHTHTPHTHTRFCFSCLPVFQVLLEQFEFIHNTFYWVAITYFITNAFIVLHLIRQASHKSRTSLAQVSHKSRTSLTQVSYKAHTCTLPAHVTRNPRSPPIDHCHSPPLKDGQRVGAGIQARASARYARGRCHRQETKEERVKPLA